ncbi:hypothetical protein ACKAV7_006816 [Fusarium commune]
MSNPHFVQVPREGKPSPNIVHQSTAYSEQTNAWLREGHKDMPWHMIDLIVTCSPDTSESNPNRTLPLRAVPIKRQVNLICHITSSINVPLKVLSVQ